MAQREITFEITERIAVLSNSGIMSKELNMVSWNNGRPKYDLRSWKLTETGEKTPAKGLTMNDEEMETLKSAITNREI